MLDTVEVDGAIGNEFFDDFHHLGDDIRVVAVAAVVTEAEEVSTGFEGHADGLFEAVLSRNGAHGEVVGDDYSIESQTVA